jgi:hypothetical protein
VAWGYFCQTFFEKEKLVELIVPMPSFHESNKRAWYADSNNDQSIQQHAKEIEIICKYSPYKTPEELFAQFDKIKS